MVRLAWPTLGVLALTFTFSGEAIAQTPPRAAPPARPQPGPLPAAAPSAPVQPAATAAQLPTPPTVNDPMLAPVPPASKSVGTWPDVLDLIRARSTELRIAYAEVMRAEGQSRIALAGTLPSLTGQGALRKELLSKDIASPLGGVITTPNTDLIATGSLTLSQPLFAPRVWYGIKTAHIAEEVAKLSVEEIKRDIALRVASALIAVVTSERVAELNRIGLRTALERLDLTSRKRALGAATGLDVLRSQQDVELARATLVTGDESLRQSREALGLALGLADPVGVAPDINLDGLEKQTGTVCRPAGSLEQRADIAAAMGRERIAERGIGDVKWQFSPTINAQSTLATTSASNANPATTWNIQGVLSWAIWEGGARYGALRSAEAEVIRNQNVVEQTKRSASIEINQAIRAVSVAESSRKVAADARTLAAEAERLARAGYLEGQGTSLELVIAAQQLRQADITLALREFELVRARIAAVLANANCPF